MQTSSSPAIVTTGIGKRYRIGQRQPYRALRDTLADAAALPRRALRALTRRESATAGAAAPSTFWALKDVSFTVGQGEVVGVIGRNGAGKSTLLKILSRITEPTEGMAEIRGHVGSLLEVGTGFHPELTGRENVYLNSAILGMRRAEVDRKFDEIVAFAEVEKFLDTPVKFYSSGMYTRLAFAVAAHMDPDILLVDEVLAVGDAAFQRKCLGKMRDVADGGRTVLFVSHQMTQIRRLCGRCVWLDGGQVHQEGPAAQVIAAYERALTTTSDQTQASDEHTTARFVRWQLETGEGEPGTVLAANGPLTVSFGVRVNRRVRHGHHGVALYDAEGQLMWATSVSNLELEPGVQWLSHALQGLPLRPGLYRWHVSLYDTAGLVDQWHASPDLVIATQPLGHHLDMWQGVLNVSATFAARAAAESAGEAATLSHEGGA